jgi:glycosyltransferase involved in cell wall biosynthesis
LVVVHAPELLPLTLLWRSLGQNRQFFYDVRENYALNILTQQVYPGLVRRVLAGVVRRIETAAARRAACITLAERSYADELPFAPAGQTVILENKYQPQPGEVPPTAAKAKPTSHEPLRLLYSGTISELNGVLDAVAFVRELRAIRPATHLTIIGFCQQPDLLRRLREAVAAEPEAITLIGGGKLVQHAEIVAAIQHSHIGLLPYRPHPSTWRCLPTKLFEYAAHGLPMILPDNPLWLAVLAPHQAALRCPDFTHPSAATLLRTFHSTAFYSFGVPDEVFWSSEAAKLWRIVDAIA